MIELLVVLFTKHYIVDFPLQPKWMYANKGRLGHIGGLAHAFLHGTVSLIILLAYTDPTLAWALAIGEAIVHYFIDWAKVNINSKMGWGPSTHEQFWWLLGLDQWLHALCYLAIVAWASTTPSPFA